MTLVLLIVAAWLVLNGVVAAGLVAYGRHVERRATQTADRAGWDAPRPLRAVGH